MSLYELDTICCDDYVETLWFPDCSVVLECNSRYDCTGQTLWKNKNGGGIYADAKIRLRVTGATLKWVEEEEPEP